MVHSYTQTKTQVSEIKGVKNEVGHRLRRKCEDWRCIYLHSNDVHSQPGLTDNILLSWRQVFATGEGLKKKRQKETFYSSCSSPHKRQKEEVSEKGKQNWDEHQHRKSVEVKLPGVPNMPHYTLWQQLTSSDALHPISRATGIYPPRRFRPASSENRSKKNCQSNVTSLCCLIPRQMFPLTELYRVFSILSSRQAGIASQPTPRANLWSKYYGNPSGGLRWVQFNHRRIANVQQS
jgi:hypothetical protein